MFRDSILVFRWSETISYFLRKVSILRRLVVGLLYLDITWGLGAASVFIWRGQVIVLEKKKNLNYIYLQIIH